MILRRWYDAMDRMRALVDLMAAAGQAGHALDAALEETDLGKP